ncbi:unnamed protein product [Staurois parvus]|uniref:Uncharacterized protein n=1 Tax=Staurois parvus TaxID=386267 RepID=A0ABN9EAH6_9NEOB|nr:unnamed protein product [Staurois parvus]
MHMPSFVCIAREEFFFSWEIACDQHRANQHCPDRGLEVSHPPRAEKTPPTNFNQCSADADEKRYLAVYIN